MPNRVQSLRSNTTGARPTGRQPGELYVNWADSQIGVVNAANAAQDLVAVRFFSTTANYAVGDFVIQGGQLYRATVASSAGSFLPANWEQIAGSAEFLPLAGGVMTGSLILKADPGALLEAATKQYVDTKAGLYLPLAGGVLTGSLTGVSATFSGALTVNGAATFAGNPVKISLPAGASFANCPTIDASAGTARALFGSTNGSPRWRVTLGNTAAESGANAGSDFALASFDDSGALLGSPLVINRANNVFNLNGVGSGAWSGTAGAAVGNCQFFLNKAAGAFGAQLAGTSNGSLRWRMDMGDSSPESTGNVGSIWALNRYSDAGASLGTVMSSGRAGGVVTFTAAIVNGPSDRRLKDNIEPIEYALDKVNALQGVSFNLTATPEKREIGLIAQDVESVVPEVMQSFTTTGEDGKTTGDYLALDYPKLTALLIEAVKTLTQRVNTLENLTRGENDGTTPEARHPARAPASGAGREPAPRPERGEEYSRPAEPPGSVRSGTGGEGRGGSGNRGAEPAGGKAGASEHSRSSAKAPHGTGGGTPKRTGR